MMGYILEADGKTDDEIRRELEHVGMSENDIQIVLTRIREMEDE